MKRRDVLTWALTALIVLAPSPVFPDSPTVESRAPASIWWVPLVSAFIGAFAALATPFLKDLLVQIWNDKRVKFDEQREIFRNYAAPLTASAEKLIWRFCEIFVDNRYQFLKTATRPLVYNEYKRKSTLYRIACLLGWIRAINLELSSLPRGASGFLAPISDAIGKVQSALADGPYVEIHRLERLCDVWGLDLTTTGQASKSHLATKLEVKLYELAGDNLKHDSDHLKKIRVDERESICRDLSSFLCQELKRTRLDDGVINETVNRAIAAMSFREALVYRDWQDAIGDSMLELDPDSVRRFKMIGYQGFEEVLKGDCLWMEVFRDSINDIDFESLDPNDFRATQLKDLAVSVAKILIALSTSTERDLVSAPALEVANKLACLN
jgi:hypothetical protein